MASGVRQGLVAFFVVVFFAGCAGTSEPVRVSYNRSSGETTYETEEMRLEDIQITSGIQQKNRFYVQVSGACTGEDCVPSQFFLRFIKEGPQPVTTEGREVTLTVGSETLRWEDPQSRETARTSTIRSGTFTKVDLSSKQLSTIGGGSSVKGTVGGERFSIPYQNRAPIRALLSRLEQTEDESSEEERTSTSGEIR